MLKLIPLLIAAALAQSAYAVDTALVQNQIAALNADHALRVYRRKERPTADAAEDARFAKQLAHLQNLISPAPSPSPSESP